MAESYRGLTIRIGGDTTGLNKALRAANQAVAGTQGELRKLSQALRFDPTSLKASQLQMSGLAEQASNVASRVITLNQAIRQVGNSVPEGATQTVKEMAEGWKNVQMNAALAHEEVKTVTASLATEYTAISNQTKKLAKDMSQTFGDDWTIGTSVEKMRDEIAALPSVVAKSDSETTKFIKTVESLQKRYETLTERAKNAEEQMAKATTALQKSKAEDRFDKIQGQMKGVTDQAAELFEQFTKLEGKKFSVADGDTDIDEVTTALKELAQHGLISAEAVDETAGKVSRLKDVFKEASVELSKANKVAAFTDTQAEAAKAEAQLESYVNELVKLNQVSDTARGMGKLSQELDDIDASSKTAAQSLAAVINSMKANGQTDALKADAVRAYGDATTSAQMKVANLQKQIAQYDDEEVIQLANSTSSLISETAKATQKYAEAAKWVANYDAELAKVKKRIGELEATDRADTDEYKNLVQQVESLEVALERVNGDADEARQEMQKFVAAIELRDKNRELTETESILEALAKLNLDPATASLKDLEKALVIVRGQDPTPKVDAAAFMQSVNMVAQAARQMGQEVVQAANDIDSAYRDMRKTVNATDSEFEALKDAAIEFSQTHVTSADTMLEMQALGGQLGVAANNLAQFGTIASNLDIATDIEAEDIALKLGQVSNVLQLDIDGMQGFADALVRLGNNMPAQESSIMAVAQRFGAVASTANFSAAEILAWSASIASTGQRSEAAATAIGNTVSGIEQAIAKGGDSVQAFATIADMSADEFTQAWKDSPTEALKAFIEGLHTLTESDASAVAALENMGITGVRQQQTLLGLSQTIDKLDDALVMSSDAFHGLADQWGQSNDAAVEAQKKSEGFSGALSILQNNAQNLAAAFGESMVEPMRIAANFLALMTDLIKGIPGPLMTLITAMGGVSVVLPVFKSVFDMFSTAYTQITTATQTTSSITSFITSLLGIGTAGAQAATGAAAASTALVGVEAASAEAATGAAAAGAAMSGPMVLGIMAVITAIGMAWSAFDQYNQHQETLRMATEGLTSAMSASTVGYDSVANGAANAKLSISELHDEIDKTIEAQAQLAEKMQEDWEGIGASEATIDSLVDTITEYANKAHLSAEEQAELYAAVESFNTMTGQSVAITDEANGKLDTSIHTIQQYADAWKESARSQQALENYQEEIVNLAEAEAQLADLQGRFGGAAQSAVEGFVDMRDGAMGATNEVSNNDAKIKELEDTIASSKQVLKDLVSEMGGTEKQLAAIETVLAGAGDSLANYGDLTDDQLRKVIEAYNNTADKSTTALQRIRAALAEIKSDAADASNVTGEAMDAALEEASKAERTARYNQQKDAYAEENRLAKQAYDDQYKDLQRSLDAEYKAAQKANDAAYKAQQKAFDAEYKQVQKQLDKEYKEWQKYYDSIYKQRQKELDAAYDATKKSLDNEYDQRKKQYDAELKLLKDHQDDEVDAFKAATDAKLKEMEREYKARVKALEAEYGIKTDDIDDKIDELNAETEAEKKAIEERNQNDKIAELKKSVEKAKSRRTRAEAEKALNDYIQEVEQKRHEESRKSEIEQLKQRQDDLKDELAARKEQLKEEYDAEVEEYKAKRAKELEALQEANTLEYDTRKAQFDLLLEQLKEQHTVRLEALKEAQTFELEQLKEAQTAQLESIKENQTLQLESMKEAQSASLEAMKEGQTAALDSLKQSHQDQLDELKRHQENETAATKATQDAKLEAIKNGTDQEVAVTDAANNKLVLGTRKMVNDVTTKFNEMGHGIINSLRSTHQGASAESEGTSNDVRTSTANMVSNVTGLVSGLANDLTTHGRNAGLGFADGISYGESTATTNSQSMSDSVLSVLDSTSEWAKVSGQNMAVNFANGILSEYAQNALNMAANAAANAVSIILHHSTPEKGPLKDDDKWGGDFIQNIIDGMASKERDLLRQTQRMAQLMENGFDPDLSVQAAIEATDKIAKRNNAAINAANAAAATSAPVISLEVNMNVSGVSVRSDSDIDALSDAISRKMAAATARELAGRLG